MVMDVMNYVTPKAGANQDLLFDEPASAALTVAVSRIFAAKFAYLNGP
jgi:hypothetical protein